MPAEIFDDGFPLKLWETKVHITSSEADEVHGTKKERGKVLFKFKFRSCDLSRFISHSSRYEFLVPRSTFFMLFFVGFPSALRKAWGI